MASSSSSVHSILGGIRGFLASTSLLGVDVSPREDMDRVGVGDSSMSCKIPLILSSFDTDLMADVDLGALTFRLGKLLLQSSGGKIHEFVEFERFESFEFDPLEFDPLEFLHSLFSVRLVADDRVDDRVSIVDVSALCVLTLSSSA